MEDCHRIIAALERVFSCHVCFHDYEGLIIARSGNFPLYHRNPACEQLRGERKNFLLCCDMEAGICRRELSSRRRAFFKRCHAGFCELALPVFHGGGLVGAMFVGPFGGVDDDKIIEVRQDIAIHGKASLPRLSSARAMDLMIFAGLAVNSIEKALERQEKPGSETAVSDRIRRFINLNFRRELYLKDLAAQLGVGETRACQIVMELFACGFSELLTQRRLEHARYLLKGSCLKIEAVAADCGYADCGYFFRTFKRHNHISPGEYRRKYQKQDILPQTLQA